MNIYLLLEDKLYSFSLSKDISGSYSFDPYDNEISKLINVEAYNGAWYLYSTSDVKILLSEVFHERAPLVSNRFYELERNNHKYLIYASELNLNSIFLYSFNSNLKMVIGNDDKANVKYNCEMLNNKKITLSFKNNFLIINNNDGVLIYKNNLAIKNKEENVQLGDEIWIYGLKIIFLNGMVMIRNIPDALNISMEQANLFQYNMELPQKPENIKIVDVDLYKKDDYYSKAPRLRRSIVTKDIKFSKPPQTNSSDQTPLALTLGPMFTMGIVSFTTLSTTLNSVNSGSIDMEDAKSQIIMSVAMLASTLLWPLLTQLYTRIKTKIKLKTNKAKYSKYLKNKQKELEEEANLQKDILFENLVSIDDCLNILNNKNVNFWDKRVDQDDLLVARIGTGNELLDVKIQYPEEDFSVEVSNLKKKADELVREFKYLKNVPIGYSFYKNKITAIMGDNFRSKYFLRNIILQFVTFYSYEDIKLVTFTNEWNKYDWDFLKYYNHSFSNDKSFRFFASDVDSGKMVADYLNIEVNNRLANMKNQNQNQRNNYKPYYVIIIDDYERVKRYDFIKTLTELDVNLGFSIIIVENKLNRLPSKCNNFITVGEKTGKCLINAYEEQKQQDFNTEINYNVNMMEVGRVISNIPIEFETGVSQLPDAITFLQMEKVGKVEQLNILNRWRTNDSTVSLKTEVGVDADGELMYLDLHEKFHGPHGLIAGTTGSGKSEFIITYILSLAMNYSPDDVSFILIDYKGGGLAFAFENKTTGVVLPHLAGTITNLDKAEMDRTLVSIDSEVKRRQSLFNEARDKLGESTIDIYKYQKFYKEGKLDLPIPHLFIICDEFAELKSQQPDFMDNLISVARIGRSLGVHLILATQKPTGVVNDQIWSNTKFRVCLKVQDASDSNEMLKKPDAAALKQSGRFYLQVGMDEIYALGQSGWCGAKYYPSDKILKKIDKSINFINDYSGFIKSIQAQEEVQVEAQGEQLAAIMNNIIEVSKQVNKKAQKLWLDNIPNIIFEEDLIRKYNIDKKEKDFVCVIGEYDAPENQKQGPVIYDYLEDGNTYIVGTDGSESEQLLSSIIYSTSKHYTADKINFYIVDYGSESLRRYLSLPQMGGMVFSGEDEKFKNLLKMLNEEMQYRKKILVDYGGDYKNYKGSEQLPLKVVVFNNYDSIYEANQDLYDILPEYVRDSERYGIIYIFVGNAVNSVQSKVSQNLNNTYAFKLKDSSDYNSLFGTRSKTIPRDSFGRGLIEMDGVLHEFQTTSITENPEDLNDYLLEFINNQKEINSVRAKRIPVLPDIVRYEDVVGSIKNLNQVPVGISGKELDVVEYDLLANFGTVISSNKIKNTINFIHSLIAILKNMNVFSIIIDSVKLLNLKSGNNIFYYNDNFDDILEKTINYINQLVESNNKGQGVIIIYGLNKFVNKLSDSYKMEELSNALKKYEKVSIIFVDDSSKIKNYQYESWYTAIVSNSDGMWIGRGVTDQDVIRISNVTREMTKDIKNDVGYVVNEGVPIYCKYIDFITKKDGEE